LEFVWNLVLGIWNLDFGAWNLEFVWNLVLGFWNLKKLIQFLQPEGFPEEVIVSVGQGWNGFLELPPGHDQHAGLLVVQVDVPQHSRIFEPLKVEHNGLEIFGMHDLQCLFHAVGKESLNFAIFQEFPDLVAHGGIIANEKYRTFHLNYFGFK